MHLLTSCGRPEPMWPVERLSHRFSVCPDSAHRHVLGSAEICGGGVSCVNQCVRCQHRRTIQHTRQSTHTEHTQGPRYEEHTHANERTYLDPVVELHERVGVLGDGAGLLLRQPRRLVRLRGRALVVDDGLVCLVCLREWFDRGVGRKTTPTVDACPLTSTNTARGKTHKVDTWTAVETNSGIVWFGKGTSTREATSPGAASTCGPVACCRLV